jgi:peroxiredoxin
MEKTAKDRLKVGDAAPDFTLPAVDGQAVSLSGITSAGSRVLLVFLRHLG